ncbi:DNA-binding transcriptional regulator [Pontiella agarivorans]|uniref:Substrate-binding domain-containing protein n=1 Tax=Pontiella agarivorans TaxID=3038953 RepID=A0ABU5N2A9_9BACT|nr:substrate-binding domain-containing protein [Pontiella agarivorans]MDZ8120526.1 substrate-binding domain-containing protein [Pontiella agarivorans]
MPSIKKVMMIQSNYDTETHKGIARAAQELGWHLNVSMMNAFQIPKHWKGDGIICSMDNNRQLEEFIRNAGLPCVDLSEWRSDLHLPRVSADNKRIGQMAAEHFRAFGHHSFAYISYRQHPVSEARYQGFKKELIENGIAAPSRLVGRHSQDEIMQWLDTLAKPSSILAYNDVDAAWLLSNCMEAGYRVPEDFAILGVDNNLLICEHQPVPLSSINHDHERIGYEGAQLLAQIMNGIPPKQGIIYIEPAGITQRASTNALATNDPLVRQAMSYLIENLRHAIGTPEIAAELGVSRRTLEQRFRATLGSSIHRKLTEQRLKKAENLLCTSQHSVEEIAALCGFCHAPHLSRVFKKEYGLPPLAYRKANTP